MKKKYELHVLCLSPKPTIQEIKNCLETGVDINSLGRGHTALFYALLKQEIEIIDYLLSRNADPNLSGPNSLPPLVHFTAERNKDKVLTLLKHPNIDINARALKNATALFIAVQKGFEEIVEILLARGADTTICSAPDNVSTLHMAISKNYINIIEKLIKAKPELPNLGRIFLSGQISPLCYAAEFGNLDVVNSLIKHGAAINPSFKQGISALYMAAVNGHPNVVQRLLQEGANYQDYGSINSRDELITPLEIAGLQGHLACVEILLEYSHRFRDLIRALNSIAGKTLISKNKETRLKLYSISERIKEKIIEEESFSTLLTLQDCKPTTWEESFETLFKQKPTKEDKQPANKEAAIRYALVAMDQLLQQPLSCISYLQFLSKQLEFHWENEKNSEIFPKFDPNWIEFWGHHSMLWPIPNDQYQGVKKLNLIEKVMLDKFKQYGMGEKQFKWTGFIPKQKSRNLLLDNAFFTENRRTINGLFHGNTHNIQRTILLFAMEEGRIPTHYQDIDGQKKKLEFKEIFSALMRRDIFPSGKPHSPIWIPHSPIWIDMLDSASYRRVTFSHPHRLHSILLTNSACAGPLQDYMRYNFCTKFIQMRDLHNHVYGTNYNNKEMCNELLKFRLHLFGGIPEFAIQMDEKKELTKVSTLDTLQDEREWSIQEKQYASLRTPVGIYCNKSITNTLFSIENSNHSKTCNSEIPISFAYY